MARKSDPVQEAEEVPVAEDTPLVANGIHVYRSERYLFKKLAADLGANPNARTLVSFFIGPVGVTEMHSRGSNILHEWNGFESESIDGVRC